jgi:hypothetical protein
MQQPKILKIVSEKMIFEVRKNHFVKLFWLFCENNFFLVIPFLSIPCFAIDSSVDLGKALSSGEYQNLSESILRNFFEQIPNAKGPVSTVEREL